MSINQTIVDSLTVLDEPTLYAELEKAMAEGADRLEILASLQEGMAQIGAKFAEREYFLSELMLSAEIFVKCQELMGGEQDSDATYGTFLIGTVAGDVHDIGKNIVASIFRSSGFKVIDLGVDVPVDTFIAAIKEYDPKVVGLSCLLTTAFPAMGEIISQMRSTGLDAGKLIMIGGGPVDAATVKVVDADFSSFSVQEAVNKAIEFVQA